MLPEVRYARNGSIAIGYVTIGDGPIDLVYLAPFNSLDLVWENPGYARFLRSLASFARVIVVDRRGTGVSDRYSSTDLPALEDLVDDLAAVLDAAGSSRAALFGFSDAGALCAMFSATNPERVCALILYATAARGTQAHDYPWQWSEPEWATYLEGVRGGWGTRPFANEMLQLFGPSLAGDDRMQAWFERFMRASASPSAIYAQEQVFRDMDIRRMLPAIGVPTLVLHRGDDRVEPVGAGRYLAQEIAGATYVELAGGDHLPWAGDQEALVAEVERFVGRAWREEQATFDRVLATVLFTDIVDSTAQVARLGDGGWREVSERHDRLTRAQLGRFRGREVRWTGDGFLAVFDGPARAVRCAEAISLAMERGGVRIRAGLHTGEIESNGDDIAGLAVAIGARVGALAEAGEVLVSSTVKDLVVGSGLEFEDRGAHDLKGVPGPWHLHALVGQAADPGAGAGQLSLVLSLRTALATAGLRRLLLAFVASSLGMWAFSILFALYAYAEGGATAVGVALLVRMLPSAFAAPPLAVLADRLPRRDVLVASAGLQALALTAVALTIAANAPFGVVVGVSSLFVIAGTAYRPAQAALIPQLAPTPAEAAAANVVWGAVDYAGFLGGSLLAGLLAGVAGVSGGVLGCAVPFVVCVATLLRLQRDERPEPLESETPTALAELAAGLGTVWQHKQMRLLTGVLAAELLIQGTVDVLLVVVAIDLLEIGSSGVGWLNSAWGVGGLAGGLLALALLGRGRLASGVALGCVLAGLPLVAIGIVHEPAVALVMLGVLGVGYAVLETALLTLTQRLAPDDVLARVFGVQETLFVLGSAAGGLVAAALVAAFGIETALLITGLALPLLAFVLRVPLGRLEAGVAVPEGVYSLLRRLPMFAPLPMATIENLAARANLESHAAGAEIIRQGEEGDRFYVIDDGNLDVLVDGHMRAHRGPGECVGEIALLREQPRMATVRASSPVRLVVLDRTDFLAGVSAHARSARAAERLADDRLAEP